MLVNAQSGMIGQRRRIVSKRPNDILRHRISVIPTKRPIDENGLSDGARGGIGLHGGRRAWAADPLLHSPMKAITSYDPLRSG